jgi:hypothetical protein
MSELKTIPGEIDRVLIETFGRGENAVRAFTVADLRRLCDANGLIILPEGVFQCAECGGLRTTNASCTFCHDREMLKEAQAERDASSLRAKPRGQLNPQPICEVHGRILELEDKLRKIHGITQE